MNSRLYEGVVQHVRRAPRHHALRYRLTMFYLDLDELPDVLSHAPLASAHAPSFIRFRRDDHVGEPDVPLAETVRAIVREQCGAEPRGPIRMLTHPRWMGYVFNPVTFYYCFAPDGETVEFITAEITNTPWGERHCYALDCRGESGGGGWRFDFAKQFHISPFFPMEQRYRWRFWTPDRRLRVHMENEQDGERVFSATMVLEERALDRATIASAALRFPLMTAKVTAGIYWNALLLKLKGVPFHAHPGAKPADGRPAPIARPREIRQ